MLLDDVVTILTTAGVGTFGTNIFASTKAAIPVGNGPFLTITETGGSAPEDTHNAAAAGFPAYVRPNVQILVRGSSYSATRLMADAAYMALYNVQNQFINSVWWRSTNILQEPFDTGLDDLNRATVTFNVSCVKRRDAATSA